MHSQVSIEQLIAAADQVAVRQGAQYARAGRVRPSKLAGKQGVFLVRGSQGTHRAVVKEIQGRVYTTCTCRSPRNPCQHVIAAAWTLAGSQEARDPSDAPTLEQARGEALEERLEAARSEELEVSLADPPFLRVEGRSGRAHRVELRGGPEGPHGCTCPDFESNELHTCKHVERVRLWLAQRRGRLPEVFANLANEPRIYLHFGETIEPRVFGDLGGARMRELDRLFTNDGHARPALVQADASTLLRELQDVQELVEPSTMQWLVGRSSRRPILPAGDPKDLLPALPLTPYPYQWTGAAFLARRGRALLADEMGLGKTVQAILATQMLRRAADPVNAVTIICPASLRGGWEDEIRRWTNEEATQLVGSAAERRKAIQSRPRWLITHYEQVLRDVHAHEQSPPDLLIIDEAQRAKNFLSRTATALKAIPARYMFALTGTPLENRLEEAYAIAQLVDQRLLLPLWRFRFRHFVLEPGRRRVVGYRHLGEVRSRLEASFLRRRKEEVALELPERVRNVVLVPMHEAVRERYDDVMLEVARIAARKVLRPVDLDRLSKLLVIARRCCDGPQLVGARPGGQPVPKLLELEQTLRELCLGEGRKAVVFSEWTGMTDLAEALVHKLRLPVFHLKGSVAVRERPALVRGFTRHEGPAVFLSTDAGGVGLNLQAADVVVNLDLPWNPARLEQRIARAHRIGSRRTVQIVLLVTQGTIEERILGLHDVKRNVLENVWAKEGADDIPAPGGGEAYRQMVVALTDPASGRAARGSERSSASSGTSPVPAGAATELRADAPAEEPLELKARIAPTRTPAAAHGAPMPGPSIDPLLVAQAMQAIAPSLPPEHRKSLAGVFRALADALDERAAEAP